MSEVAVRVEGLSKRYRIGQRQESYSTLRDTIVDVFTGPFRRLSSALRRQPPAVSDNTVWALKEVSFEVQHGEIVGIMGRNGAGKSTLLKVLSRITEPTEGYAEIHGRVGSLLEVGTGFHPELTGRENIYLNGAILGMKRVEIGRKFDEIVDFSEVEKFLDTPVKHYSSGMYVRLAFAVAAHLEPEILLVDEVLAVGDAAFQRKCLGKMGNVAREGRTVLFVSHNMFSLQNLCTRGILLETGRMAKNGEIGAVIEEYLAMGRQQAGEVSWPSPEVAPGDERVRLKAVRVASQDGATGDVDLSRQFEVQVDYWNLLPGQRAVYIQIFNSMGVCVLLSLNLPSASLTPDPWYSRPYPCGLFRTSCTIPGYLLNDGLHTINLRITEGVERDKIVSVNDIISFMAVDSGEMRQEYTGKWVGVVRPRLGWQTTQLG